MIARAVVYFCCMTFSFFAVTMLVDLIVLYHSCSTTEKHMSSMFHYPLYLTTLLV